MRRRLVTMRMLRSLAHPSLPLLSLLLAAAAAATAVIFLQRYVESRENERFALEQVESRANALGRIEWQAIANAGGDSATAERFTSALEGLRVAMRHLAGETGLQADVATYAAAVRDELLLIAIGQIEDARRINAERVEPAFNSIIAAIDAEQVRHADEAARARKIERVGAAVTIALTVGGAIGFILRRLRAREVALLERNAAAALQESEGMRLAVLESSADGIITSDEHGLIESFNPAAERLLGYAAAEVIGRNVTMLMPESFRRTHDAFLEHYGQTGHPDVIGRVREVEGLRKDGEAFPIEISIGEAHVGGRRVYVGSVRDITRRKQLEEELRHQAFHDPLTGLANRARFTDRIEHALARRRRQPSSFAVLFLDLDDFKAVNDVHGHPAGDDLLVAVARRLAGCVRPEDTLARFGGDEFALLLEDIVGRDGATAAADHILATLAAPFAVAGTAVVVGTSIGIAFCDSAEATADELLRRADVAMYVAKARGKSGRVVFDAAMQDTVVKRLALARDLQFAVERGELVVHYQPTVALAGARIAGMEALVRWQHPERGLLPPDEFIGIAEETGMIQRIGAWVLGEACTRMRAWQERFPSEPPLAIAVNVSVGQVHHPGLVDAVARALDVSGLDPGSLVLEITESVVVKDAALALRRLRELKKLGVRLAIDDFGTGYSSLNYLRRFPVDFLKIDKSFIDKIGRRGKEQDVVRTIVDLGHTLGMEIVAEGIQRADQAERLRALNCDLGQGYYFSRPLPAAEMEAFLGAADASLRLTLRAAA